MTFDWYSYGFLIANKYNRGYVSITRTLTIVPQHKNRFVMNIRDMERKIFKFDAFYWCVKYGCPQVPFYREKKPYKTRYLIGIKLQHNILSHVAHFFHHLNHHLFCTSKCVVQPPSHLKRKFGNAITNPTMTSIAHPQIGSRCISDLFGLIRFKITNPSKQFVFNSCAKNPILFLFHNYIAYRIATEVVDCVHKTWMCCLIIFPSPLCHLVLVQLFSQQCPCRLNQI